MRKFLFLAAVVSALCLVGCVNGSDLSGTQPSTTVAVTTTASMTPTTTPPTPTTDDDPVSTTTAATTPTPTPGATTTLPTPETTPAPETTTKPETTDAPVVTTQPIVTTTKPVTTKPATTTKPKTEEPKDPDLGKSVSIRYMVNNSQGGGISGMANQTIRFGQTKTTEVVAKPALGYKFVSWSDGVKTAKRSGDSFRQNTTLTANFEIDALDLPVISITTETGKDPTSKVDYINGTISISNCAEEYILSDYAMEIRGRGNYTWTSSKTAKKSWRVKLSKKQNLLGQGDGKAKSWTLIANHCDQSLIRNFTTLNYARKLEGIGFMSSVISVDVYVNGEYRGVYSLCEQNQVQEHRVNVTENPESVKTGYLVEMTGYAESPMFNMNLGGSNFKFEIKNDLSTDDDTYWAQYDFIADYFQQCWNAVASGDRARIEALIDIDSVVDTYIVEELFKNLDAGWDSFYMYYDNGIEGDVLHFGPIWDFDLSGGNVNEETGCDQYTGLRAGTMGCNPWYATLLQQSWFKALVAERWKELKSETDKIPAEIRAEASAHEAAYARNFDRWQIFGQQINREPAAIRALRTYKQHYEYYAEWMENRIAWLDSYFTSPSYQFDGKLNLGGKGTMASPYLVTSEADFLNFTLCMANGQRFDGKYFRQTADLDMTKIAGYAGVGASATFAGLYDGGGYTIKVALQGQDECIFPYLTGTIMNLFTEGSALNTQQAAGICRSVRNGGVIVNCGSSMTLSGTYAGGITSSNQSGGGTIAGCFFLGSVEGTQAASPINCYSDGRGGNYYANYYLEGITHTTADAWNGTDKNEATALAKEIADLLNQSRKQIAKAAGVSESQLLSWTTQNGKPVMQK